MKTFALLALVSVATLLVGVGCKAKDGTKQAADARTAAAGASATAPAATAPVVVMTATSAKDAMTDIAAAFEAETGVKISVAAGGSNVLANQILADAPGALFLSANAAWSNKVKEKGYASRTEPLLTNDLVLIVPKGNPAQVKTPDDVLNDSVKKVALAGENVPAGQYASQALYSMQIFPKLVDSGKIVRGQDVRVTESFVERGEAEVGVVYSTDAIRSSQIDVVYKFNPATFDKIVYPLQLLKSGANNPNAVKFYDYLSSPTAEKIFVRYGFVRLKQ